MPGASRNGQANPAAKAVGSSDEHMKILEKLEELRRTRGEREARWASLSIKPAVTKATEEHSVEGRIFSQDPFQWSLPEE